MKFPITVIPGHFIQFLGVWCGLFAWSRFAGSLECLGSMLFILPLWAAIGFSISEVALFKRQAFIAQYLRPEGLLARLLWRRTLLLLWQGIKALFLTLILLVNALLFGVSQWLLLLADGVLMSALVATIGRFLVGEVNPVYRGALARYWAHWANTLVLWSVSVLAMFYSTHENYVGMSWEAVVRFSASRVMVACDALGVLVRVNAVSEALVWWGAQNYFAGWEDAVRAVVVWLVFIASFAVSFVAAWAYSRALVGVVSRPWQFLGASAVSALERQTGRP